MSADTRLRRDVRLLGDVLGRVLVEQKGDALLAAEERLSHPITPDSLLTVERTFELAQKAHSLYLTRNYAERGQLLKTVLLNCATDGVSLWPPK